MNEKESSKEELVQNNSAFASDDISIIVPSKEYDISKDTRTLIPFMKGVKIGFMNKEYKVVLQPTFDAIREDVNDSRYIHVGVTYSYAYERKNDVPSTYTRIKWGLINTEGHTVLEPQYSSIYVGENYFIVKEAYGHDYKCTKSLVDTQGKTIVPFGVYSDIEPFENGLARCRSNRIGVGDRIELFAVINELGVELLKSQERPIKPFYGNHDSFKDMLHLLKKENPKGYTWYYNTGHPWNVMLEDFEKKEADKEAKMEQALERASHFTKLDDEMTSKDTYIAATANNGIRREKKYGKVKVIELKDGSCGVMSGDKFVVPFGTYAWIDGYDHGLARVRTKGKTTYCRNITALIDLENNSVIEDKQEIIESIKKDIAEHPEQFAKWGIIDEDGKEVLPLEYDAVWNFLGKNRKSTKVEKEGKSWDVFFSDLNPDLPINDPFYYNDRYDNGFNINDCYDAYGDFDADSLEDAIMDGEYVPEDW